MLIADIFSRLVRPRSRPAVYLHFPCFDGLISACIVADFVEHSLGWEPPRFIPVNYDASRNWLQTPLQRQSAVVDFLYHPDAFVWADHHPTTFLDEQSKRDFETNETRRLLFYDRSSPSCASMLWKHVGAYSSDSNRYGEMVLWADLIDSATYASIEEAIFGSSPGMEINLSLMSGKGADYCAFLLNRLKSMTLGEVAALQRVRRKVIAVRKLTESGLAQVGQTLDVRPGQIAVFHATETEKSIVNRYSAYWFARDARYSVGMVKSRDALKITAMRNPWLDFESVDLGKIFASYGGGGHRRVASLLLGDTSSENAMRTLDGIVAEIARQDVEESIKNRAFA